MYSFMLCTVSWILTCFSAPFDWQNIICLYHLLVCVCVYAFIDLVLEIAELLFALEKKVLHSDCNSVFILQWTLSRKKIFLLMWLTNLTHSWKMYTSLPIWCSGKLSVVHCLCSSLLYSQSLLPPSGSKMYYSVISHTIQCVWFAKIHVHS